MKVEIYKGSRWRELSWEAEAGPEVTQEIEAGGLFEFKAPYARLKVHGEGTLYWKDAGYEIRRGDLIRLSLEGLIVFKGTVDRDVEFDRKRGDIRFKALGWLAGLKDVKAGISRRWMRDGVDLVGGRYRYVKEIEEEIEGDDGMQQPIRYEQRAWPRKYEQDFAVHEKIGYKEAYIFDSLGGLGFLERHIPVFEEVEFGVYRRRLDRSALRRHGLEEIFNDVVTQINLAKGGGYSGVWDPGTLETDIEVIVIDEAFGDIDIFQRSIAGQQRIYVAGWKSSDGAPARGGDQEIEGPLKLFEIENSADASELATLEFAWNKARVLDRINGMERDSEWNHYNDRIIHIIRRKRIEGDANKALFYQMWSWVVWAPDVAGYRLYLNNVAIEWYYIDLETGDVADYGEYSKIGQDLPYIGDEPRRGPVHWYSADFIVEGAGPYRIRPDLKTGGDEQNDRELIIDGAGRWFAFEGLAYFQGNLALNSIAFDFREATVTDVLKTLAIHTNSLLLVSDSKQIMIVKRDYVNAEQTIRDDELLDVQPVRRRDYWGERTPQIHSQIVMNEEYVNAIERFYENEYFPGREEWYRLKVLASTNTAQIGLLDKVKFPRDGFSMSGATFAQVRRVRHRQGEVELEVMKSLE